MSGLRLRQGAKFAENLSLSAEIVCGEQVIRSEAFLNKPLALPEYYLRLLCFPSSP